MNLDSLAMQRQMDEIFMRDRDNTIGMDAQRFYSVADDLIKDAALLTPLAARNIINTCRDLIRALEAKPGMRP